ncbi:hypothetical protein LIER_08669 [Lithospermum erythrorhizon]|uniref:Uncharacterized protein n=1 Tax=Lithospermum erythrorhizon TaxID=34254 RepID=A0AAV3PEJ8_LITER
MFSYTKCQMHFRYVKSLKYVMSRHIMISFLCSDSSSALVIVALDQCRCSQMTGNTTGNLNLKQWAPACLCCSDYRRLGSSVGPPWYSLLWLGSFVPTGVGIQ